MKTPIVRVGFLLLVLATAAGPVFGELVGRPDWSDSFSDQERDSSDEWATRDCLLEPHIIIDLASPVPGVISTIKVDKGDKVKQGSTLVLLRSEVERALVNLKRAEVRFGRKTIARNNELYEQNLISPQERDEIALQSDLARLELVVAQSRLQQKQIVSPIDGVVLEKLMDPGEYVNEFPMLRIASLDPLYVEAVLPRELFGSISSGMQAEVGLEEPVGGIRNATVAIVDQVIDAASGTFGVRLLLPNADNSVPAGLKCKVRFVDIQAAE